MKICHILLLFFCHTFWISVTFAKRKLSASSLVTCMPNSQLSSSKFNIVFNPDDNSFNYDLSLTSDIDGYVTALIQVYAYGFEIITRTIDMCSMDFKQFCPLYPGPVDIDSTYYLSSSDTSAIPNIAYTVPDIDAFVRISIQNSNQTQLACIQAAFSNGRTVSHTAVKWVTALIAGFGLLTSSILKNTIFQKKVSHISANAVSLFIYFQNVVIVTMQHVDQVPPIASAWSENLAWSMGLIETPFMQKIFRWFIQSTGGTPTLYLTSNTISILVQRAYNLFRRYFHLMPKDLIKIVSRDDPVVLYGNKYLLIFRGIRRLGYLAHIEKTSIVITAFTFFVLFAYLLTFSIFLIKFILIALIKLNIIDNQSKSNFNQNFKYIIKGSLLRYIFIGFTQLVIFSLWEFTERDSPAVVVLAALFLFLSFTILCYSSLKTISFGRRSIQLHKNPAYILYGDQNVLHKFGFFYTMFNAHYYYWGSVILVYSLLKSIVIGLLQSWGKVQAILTFIIDLIYLILLIKYKPFLDKPTNVLNILISVVTTINAFLFIFFSNLFGQPAAVSSIMGWVFFILNAAFSLILLLLIIFYTFSAIFSRNPDARFQPAKDDRTSFQKNHPTTGHDALNENDANEERAFVSELFALGKAAKDHQSNWAEEVKSYE
ncbi:transient receptor potential ion channel family protein, partial [Ascoidea rubescens DSM 1968]